VEAYNNVKHSDIYNFAAGNLLDALNASAALACMVHLFTNVSQRGGLFVKIGFYDNPNLKDELFFTAAPQVNGQCS